MKKIMLTVAVLASLGGCAVYPAPVYGPHVAVVAAPVYVAPRPYYYHW